MSLLDVAALAILVLAAGSGAQGEDLTAVPRDPDRGLPQEQRALLALADPAADAVPVERHAALAERRARLLARLWEEDRLAVELADAEWIDGALRVGALSEVTAEAGIRRGPWRVTQVEGASEEPADRTFAEALAAWRADFGEESRLDVAVVRVSFPREGEVRTRVRCVASGGAAGVGDRLQHVAIVACRWRIEEGGLSLVGLERERFEAVRLVGHPRGLYADVTERVLGGGALHRDHLSRGLDHWRETIAASLEPGLLGHHGLAIGDVDGDGREDVYLCQPGGLPNRLLLAAADHSALERSAAAGVDLLDYSSSALLVDLDGDGPLDLVVSTGRFLVFFAGDGEAGFEERLRIERPLATSLAAADFDGDRDLDLYVCSYLSPYEQSGLPVPYHDAENGPPNALLRNDGSFSFTDVTDAVGLDANGTRFSFAASWEDYDNDGDPDLYVVNDFGRNNLYANEGGRFTDVAPAVGAEDISAGMGVSWGDVDEDGWLDLYVTNMDSRAGARLTAAADFRPGSPPEIAQAFRDHAGGNSLLVNRGGARFEDVSEASGTALGRWGWGGLMLDFDSDGRLDILAPNGFVTGDRGPDLDSAFWRLAVLRSPDSAETSPEYAAGWQAMSRLVRQGYSWNGDERNAVFWNLGERRFVDVSSVTGLDVTGDARAAARVDWDGDGDLDLVVTHRTGPMVRFFANGHDGERDWVAFRLRAAGGGSAAVGARIEVETTSGRRLVRALRCGEGYLAQSSSSVHFGLGDDGVRSALVRWPAGGREVFEGAAAGSAWLLEEGAGRAVALAHPGGASRLVALRDPAAPVARRGGGETLRTVLASPLPIPRLLLETREGRSASLLGISPEGARGTGKPLAIVVWDRRSSACRRDLGALAAAAEDLRGAGLDLLALAPGEPDAADRAEGRRASLECLESLAWPFAVGFASEEALQILESISGVVHDSARPLAIPSAFLVDAGGRLIAIHRGRLDPARLGGDLALLELSPEARRDAAVPFPGRWIAPPPEAPLDAIATRLEQHGLERPAGEYRLAKIEVRPASPAGLLHELGLARQRQGRLAEAIDHYRRALEADPGHVGAAQCLAVAHHQQGEHALALAAYERALELDPDDELTRCNLAFLHLALDDVPAAREALEVLRARGSEYADALDEGIRLHVGGE